MEAPKKSPSIATSVSGPPSLFSEAQKTLVGCLSFALLFHKAEGD
jgi:hypothetical protein